MTTRPRSLWSILIPMTLLAITVLGTSVQAEERIAFLYFKYTDTSISLVDADIVPGSLKQPQGATATREIRFDVHAAADTVHSGSIDNPLTLRLEYEDPDNPGQLKMKIVELSEATVMIRLPYREDLTAISFSRPADTDDPSVKRAATATVVDITSIHGSDHD